MKGVWDTESKGNNKEEQQLAVLEVSLNSRGNSEGEQGKWLPPPPVTAEAWGKPSTTPADRPLYKHTVGWGGGGPAVLAFKGSNEARLPGFHQRVAAVHDTEHFK